jgi:RimJ/RimL family protein N-acetyltransferase
MWVMELGGAIVGQVRYDRTEPGCAEIGFSVAAAFRGRGIGTRMLTATCQDACRELGTQWARGTVFKENVPSARAFVKAGFVQAGVIERQGRSWYLFKLQRV